MVLIKCRIVPGLRENVCTFPINASQVIGEAAALQKLEPVQNEFWDLERQERKR